MAKNIGRIRIFGVDIVVTTSDQPSHSSLGGFLEEKDFQEDDQKGAKFSTIDHDHVDTSLKLSTVDDDDVDTSLKLSTSVSRSCDSPVYCPIPLRCFPPGIVPTVADFWIGRYYSATDHQVDTSNGGENKREKSRKRKQDGISGEKKREESRKRKQDGVGGEKKRRSAKRRRRDNGADDQSLNPMEEIPEQLQQIIESRKGTKPVFLYGKKLEESDASGHHNRLFVTKRDKIVEFLNDEEKTALENSKEGLEVFAVDPRGKLYKLGLKIWQSLKMMVVNSDWNKLVVGNNAHKGDWIQMWGYREKEKLRFAVSFKKSEA